MDLVKGPIADAKAAAEEVEGKANADGKALIDHLIAGLHTLVDRFEGAHVAADGGVTLKLRPKV